MWRRVTAAAALSAAAVALPAVAAPPRAAAHGHDTPGMCNGRSDANLALNAKATRSGRATAKYILNLRTDAVGAPTT
jgi:hypothetical protein